MKTLSARVMRQKTLFRVLGMLLAGLLTWSGIASSQSWIPVATPQFPVGVAMQLTDGTIMVQENKTSNWWQLRPDEFGH
jgi:predicted histidine transporter YuiF (NhaC family)